MRIPVRIWMRMRRSGGGGIAVLVAGAAVGLAAGAAGADQTSVEGDVVVIRGSELGGAFPEEEAPPRPPELVGVPFEWRRAVYPPRVAPPCYLTTSAADETLWGGTERRGLLKSNYCPWY